MNKDIVNALLPLKVSAQGNPIWTLAMVSETSYEVVSYTSFEGRLVPINELVENGLASLNEMDFFDISISKAVKGDSRYKPSMMNAVQFEDDRVVAFRHDELDCSMYKKRKEWRESLKERLGA